jgi:hypothetical protein
MGSMGEKMQPWKRQNASKRPLTEEWAYPTGMVWCPMKLSGMAIMKCAALQKQFGCGSLHEFKLIAANSPAIGGIFWPWLRRGRECPERADEKEVRELRLALSPLKSVEKSRKNPRAYVCSSCGGDKSFGARRCRRCWRGAARNGNGFKIQNKWQLKAFTELIGE